jgi:anaerobic dimethyl sulfoxide reductase subunit B (iron-sulfur subunit)
MAQKGFFVNMKRCLGCYTCQIACKDYFDLDIGEFVRYVARYEGGKYPAPYVYSLSLACGHCDRPACMAACPEGALTKDADTGLVLHNKDRCVGCRKCGEACPYDAPTSVKATEKMRKCDGCKDRLDEGKQPVCVTACRARALEFDDIAVLKKAHPDYVDRIKHYADPAQTGPNVIFKPRPESVQEEEADLKSTDFSRNAFQNIERRKKSVSV